MRTVKKVPFPSLRGPVAAPPGAFGLEFNVLASIGGEPFERNGECAIVDVCGPLVQHSTFLFPSYDSIRANCLAAFASDAKIVVLRLDSPGGDFAGSLELGVTLREMARAAQKRLVAFTDSSALSAAYGIACAADEIVITTSAYVGSIGVWAALVDQTAQDRAQGLNIAIVASGTRKADRNPHVPISEEALAALQAEVDAMAGLFFDAVSSLRGITRERIEALQGAQVFGANAVSAGLADRIVNGFDSFIEALSEGDQTMAGKSMKEARAAYRATLAKLASEESDDGKEAASALAEFDKDEDKKAKKAEADKEKESASAEGGDKEPDGDEAKKAAAEEDTKKAAAAEEEKKAAARSAGARMAATGDSVALEALGKVAALEAKLAAREEETERLTLLATRPDFDGKVKAWLASAPIATVREAVKSLPRFPNANAAIGAIVPGATRGKEDVTPATHQASSEEVDFIKEKMHRGNVETGVVTDGRSLTLGFMSRASAAKRLAEITKEEGK